MREQKRNPLIILATYWNERYFIEPSLWQIEALNPCEIIIADGCFDPRIPNHSTDGTREIINEFVAKNPNARMVSPIRAGFFLVFWMLLRGHKHLPWWTMFRPVRWKFLLRSMVMSSYRRNQAITFNYMIGLSRKWKPGRWFMTYDADHFYSDETLQNMQRFIREAGDEIGLITAHELTFFVDFTQCTTSHEKRVFPNMPHRIYADTLIQPTRSLVRETKSGKVSFFDFKKILAKHLYIFFEKNRDAGIYFHYKLNPPERFEAGYRLGDRKKPDVTNYKMKQFDGIHPSIIRDYFHL